MKIRFDGGPWDGVEFDVPFCPDAIAFRHLDTRYEPVPEEGNLACRVYTARRDHHQYLADPSRINEWEEEGVPAVWVYRYAPGEKGEFDP
jgi:hypothetical protein